MRELSHKGDGTVSRREIREALSMPDSTVRRWLADLVELEYLTQVEAGAKGAGKTSRYRLVPLEAQRTPLGLLPPEALEEIATRQKPPNGRGGFHLLSCQRDDPETATSPRKPARQCVSEEREAPPALR